MLIKIFENTFSGGDSRSQCLKCQKKKELLLQKNFSKEKAIQQLKQHLNNDLIRRNLVKRQSNKTLQNTVHIERVYSGHPLQRTPLNSGHFSRERLKSWSNSYKKTSMQQTLHSGHLYIVDIILRSQLNFFPITDLLIVDRPNYWSNKKNLIKLYLIYFKQRFRF